MTSAEVHTLLHTKFGTAISQSGIVTVVAASELLEVCRFLRDDARLGFDFLNDLCGVDYLEIDEKKIAKAGFEPHLEVVYQLSTTQHPGRRFSFKVILPRWHHNQVGTLPELASVSDIWRTAEWHEREVFDLFGVRFVNHPCLTRILLADDWMGHPLRKDYEFPVEYHGIRCR